MTARRTFQGRLLAVLAGGTAALTLLGGTAAGAPARAHTAKLTSITVNTLPIANALPLDLGIKKGFFSKQGIEINKKTLQSGNDIVLALANKSGEIGYIGWVPAMIARTQRIAIIAVTQSEVEGTSAADNWQNILVRGNSSIHTPADLSGKTIAVNALKGVGEVVIKAALKKKGVNPNSIKLTPLPFPSMRAALRNGQVDAIWTPEPFLTQALTQDGARSVMAPGPVLGKFWPNGGYVARSDWRKSHPALYEKFRKALGQSLTYATSHTSEVRALLPESSRNIRLPVWDPTIDRAKLKKLAQYAKEYGVINSLPNFSQLIPLSVTGGKTLQGIVENTSIRLLLDGKKLKSLPEGQYTFIVSDRSKTQNFRLRGPHVNMRTSVSGKGRATWTLLLRPGAYVFSSGAHKSTLKGTFKVS
ncbi:MAG TPA: ABC transporter substrate-binding protein [Gaiellaceae bacterium]|jgi:NitT/TauT family transport system substrate-binding protein|nr:ABC transporter substrate-binding protein [Gaiellaceae bacterium]